MIIVIIDNIVVLLMVIVTSCFCFSLSFILLLLNYSQFLYINEGKVLLENIRYINITILQILLFFKKLYFDFLANLFV